MYFLASAFVLQNLLIVPEGIEIKLTIVHFQLRKLF